MEKFTLKTKENKLTLFIVSVFVFARTLLFFTFDALDILYLEENPDYFSLYTVTVFVLLIAFAVMISVLVMKASAMFDGRMKYIAIAFLADILFFITQNNGLKLVLTDLGLLLIFLTLKKSDSVFTGILTALYAFAAAAVSDTAVFSYPLLAILFYFALNLTANGLKVKSIIFTCVSAAMSVGGFLVNKFFINSLPEFIEKFYLFNIEINYTPQVYYEDNMYMLIFTIPVFAYYAWFLYSYYAASEEEKKKRKKKDPPPVKYTYLVPVISLPVIALNIAALFFCFNEVYLVATLVPPAMILAMCVGGNVYAQSAVKKMDEFIGEHTALFVIAVAVISIPLLYFISDDTYIHDTIKKMSTWFIM